MAFTVEVVSAANIALFDTIADPTIFDGRVERERIARFVATPSHGLFVALSDGAIVGQLCAMIQRQLHGPDALYVDNLGVSRAHRRMGIARSLWTAACRWAGEEGCEVVWVPTSAGCEEARALYTALGLSEGSAVTFEGNLP